jgi:DNA polymerase (family 10)
MTINQKTAQLLKRVAAVFWISEGDTFRYRAYINAAVAVDNLTVPIADIWEQGKLDSVPGIGEKLVSYLDEYFSTGKVRHFDSIMKRVPSGMFSLMEIRGIGPAKSYKIANKFQLDNQDTAISDLKKILSKGELFKVAGFKEKSIRNLKKSLRSHKTKSNRMLLAQALEIAGEYITYLHKSPLISKAEPLGSLRRKLPTIGDIDIAFCSHNSRESMQYALKYPKIKTVILKGDKVARVRLENGISVDLKSSDVKMWGSLLQHYTGSKLHNIQLRKYALEKGLSLSEYGIKKDGKIYRFKTELSFYNFLGLEYIPPELRESTGEIELSRSKKIPKLVKLSDIRGDLHIHSDFVYPSSHDHGSNPLTEILNQASLQGYEYIGISDHNPKFQGLKESKKVEILKNRRKYLENEYKECENDVKLRVKYLLIGMEVDIRPDGSLALSDSALSLLDYVIASIHSSFDLTIEANTRRIINALSHPKVKILGHPTSREINKRESIKADWDKIFDFCFKNNKILEINASPTRLDLPDDLIQKAVSKGVKMIVNTDSHSSEQLQNMQYGVWHARRGYAKKKDIINTLDFKNLRQVLEL